MQNEFFEFSSRAMAHCRDFGPFPGQEIPFMPTYLPPPVKLHIAQLARFWHCYAAQEEDFGESRAHFTGFSSHVCEDFRLLLGC